MCEICSDLRRKTQERRHCRHSGVSIVKSEQVSHCSGVSILHFEQVNVSWKI